MSGVTRRRALGTLGAGGAMALGPRDLFGAIRPPLVLCDIGVDRHRLPRGEMVELERDLVRQWRDGLGHRIIGREQTIAIVRWDKALILAGLAREERLLVAQERLADADALFRVHLTRA